MFIIKDYIDQTFTVSIQDASGEHVTDVTLMGMSSFKWDDIGLMVATEEAPPIKNPKTNQFEPDVKAQRKLDAKAEMQRNAMRLVWSLENGGGIDWGGKAPSSLHEKADVFLKEVGWDTFNALLNALKLWAFGKKVSAKDESERFPDVPKDGNDDMQSSEDSDKPVD